MALNLKTSDTANKELREDLLDVITDISPQATPIYSTLGKSVATQSVHQWLKDSVGRATAVPAYSEGADTAGRNLVTPTRGTNWVQEIVKDWNISQKQEDSDSAGYTSAVSFYKAKALKEWKVDVEYALLWGTGTSTGSGTSMEMTGLKKSITTNYTSSASGGSITSTLFNNWMEALFDYNTDMNFNVYTSMRVKRAISSFTTSNTKNINAADNRVIEKVSIYEADTGTFALFAHNDIPGGTKTNAGTLGCLIAINPDAFKIAFLHSPEFMDKAVLGAYKAGFVYGSMTLEARDERGGAVVDHILGTI